MCVNFEKADSSNLPSVDVSMVFQYLKGKDVFNDPEVRGVKEQRAGRESYGDSAVGYVELHRSGHICVVRCKMCPEQRIRNTLYPVMVSVNEEENKIIAAQCHGCPARLGGCKHSVAFLLWLNRRSEEPAPTSVKCYWKKSLLASVGKQLEPCTIKDFGGKPKPALETDFLEKFLAMGSRDSILHGYCQEKTGTDRLSLHYIARLALRDSSKSFEQHACSFLTPTLCAEAEKGTKGQSDNPLWRELRYGRITASRAHEAAHCRTKDGSLVAAIIGVSKVRDTFAMARGRRLEDEVIVELEKFFNLKTRKTGLFLSQKYPWLGASPDALSGNHVIEVKCPLKDHTVAKYLNKNNEIQAKYLAQVQIQMALCNKKEVIFCVADPDFEENRAFTAVKVPYCQEYVDNILSSAGTFWKDSILPRL